MTIDHWEALFDSKYLRWFDIADKGEVTVTIQDAKKEELTMKGGVKKVAPVLTIKGAKKRFVLNKTNAESIALLHGNQPTKWKGKTITLFVTKTKLQGKDTDCIRVRTGNNA